MDVVDMDGRGGHGWTWWTWMDGCKRGEWHRGVLNRLSPSLSLRSSRFAAEEFAGVGDVEDGEVEAAVWIAFLGGLELPRDARDRADGEIFHRSHADERAEDHHQHAVFIHVEDQHAELFALLIDAVEIFL